MILWQQAWVWIVAGVVLGALEMILPGFYLLGLAIGTVLVGILIWVGVLGANLPLMLLVAAIAAAIAWWVLRRVIGVREGQIKLWDRDINEN